MVAHILERGQYLQVSPKASGELLCLGILGIVEVANSQHAVGSHIKGKSPLNWELLISLPNSIAVRRTPDASKRPSKAENHLPKPSGSASDIGGCGQL